MLTKEGCLKRRQTLQECLDEYDLLVISQPRNVFYLTGFLTRATELAGWGINFLLIDREGQSRLLTDNWNEAAAQAAFVDQADIWSWYDLANVAQEKYAAAAQALSKTMAAHYPKLERVAVDQAHLPLLAGQAFGDVQLADLSPELHTMRLVKHEDELSCIRRAIRATEAGHIAARQAIQAGRSELEIYADVESAIVLEAGEPIVMLGDFVAGQRSETGGGPPTGNILQEGDLMIFDLFPIIGGYRADITNTLCAGQPSQAQHEHLALLQAAMQAAEGMLRPGVTGAQVYEACRAPLAEAGLAETFSHHAGHGLGLGHPEPPYLIPSSRELLQAGNVVTLEPGSYRAGWGGARIEHNYLITEDGYERLSNHEIGL